MLPEGYFLGVMILNRDIDIYEDWHNYDNHSTTNVGTAMN